MTNFPKIHPAILCGGSGTRLWPESRKSFPKQFANLVGSQSLFQQSVQRFSGIEFSPPIIITGVGSRRLVEDQLDLVDCQPQAILIEPAARNTAPAVCAAAIWASKLDPDGLMLVSPADHVIQDPVAFRAAVRASVPAAMAGKIVTFGVTPTRPETGYGYLELAATANLTSDQPAPLKGFNEKPNTERAIEMFSAGKFLWNAGIFLFSVRTLLAAYDQHASEIMSAVAAAVDSARQQANKIHLEPETWRRAESISIDFAIMEKVDNLAVMPFTHRWSDLGSWESVWLESEPDDAGVVTSGNAASIDCKDTLLRSNDEQIAMVGVGLDDVIAVATKDAVLVARKSDNSRLKDVVGLLQQNGAPQATEFTRQLTPWGSLETLFRDSSVQISRLVILPACALDAAMLKDRSGQWTIAAGAGQVAHNGQNCLMSENHSISMISGKVERLQNLGSEDLIIIEIQTCTDGA